jgi:DNA polymerase elongation subunit (family B)
MVVFHILDAISQDEELEKVTEEGREVSYDSDGTVETDDEFAGHGNKKLVTVSTLQKRRFCIHLFGVTVEGKPVRADIFGFKPYFYVGLPNDSMSTFVAFETQLKKKVVARRISHEIYEVTREKKKVLYGYTNNKDFSFAKISVTSLAAFRLLKQFFLEYESSKPKFILEGKPLKVYDANLDPLLRFFHLRDIAPCGWVSVPTLEECEWEDVSPAKAPMPSAPFLLATWDIECYSESGNFPLATIDPIIQVGIVLTRAGAPTEKHIFVFPSCDPVDGAIVHEAATETEMLEAWMAFMEEKNPDILIGYNIFGFDEKYLSKRAELLGVSLDPLTRLLDCGKTLQLEEKRLSSSALGDNFLYTWSAHGRVQIDLYHYVKRSFILGSYKLDSVCQHFMSGKLSSIERSEETWVLKTKSTGDVVKGRYIVLIDETGDVVVDKLKVLDKTKDTLTVVAPTEGAEDSVLAVKWAVVKDDVSPADIFRLHRGSAADRAVIAAYCIQDCDLTYELYKKLDVFNNAMAMANTCPVPVTYIFMRGQGIKIESLIFKECLQTGQCIEVLQKDSIEESYEGAIVLDPVPGFYFDAPVGVADFASLYPSTIESENISHDTLMVAKNYDVNGVFTGYSFESPTYKRPVVEPPYQKTEAHPLTKAEESAVATFDEKDLKLHKIAQEMLGSSYYLERSRGYQGQGPLTRKEVTYVAIEFDLWGVKEDDTRKNPTKVKTGTRVCLYAQQPDDKKGTLPTIVRKLLAARKSKRKEAEKEQDPFRKALLDAEQLAYKLTANSLYGQLGSGVFKVRLQNLAASVTAYGRKQIRYAEAVIKEFYGSAGAEVVYGDTDSLFVKFNPKSEGRDALVETIHLTEEAGKLATRRLKAPHDFEYDKTFYPFIIFSKKRYVGNKYEEDPDHFSQTSMGIALKRRDNAPCVKTIYGGAIHILLNERNVEKALRFVKEKTKELVDGRMSMNQLTISKSLRAEYRTPTPPAHKMLADRMKLRDPGNAPSSGERIPYVYIKTPASVTLQGDKIEHPSYVKEKKLPLDTRYYIEHQLLNPLSQLFALCVDKMPGYTYHDVSTAETVAADLLFGDVLRVFEEEEARKNRIEGAKRLGFTIESPAVSSRPRAPTEPSSKKAQVSRQLTLEEQFVVDGKIASLVSSMNKRKKKVAVEEVPQKNTLNNFVIKK